MVRARTTASSPTSKLNGTVLLVEDEPSVRNLLRRMLEAHGLDVLAVESAQDAIVSASTSGRIDVLLTDLQLPGMSGMELARQVRELRPTLPIVFISGYPQDVALVGLRRDFGQRDFLQKPFTPAQLGETIRRLLSATPPPSGPDTMKIEKPDP